MELRAQNSCIMSQHLTWRLPRASRWRLEVTWVLLCSITINQRATIMSSTAEVTERWSGTSQAPGYCVEAQYLEVFCTLFSFLDRQSGTTLQYWLLYKSTLSLLHRWGHCHRGRGGSGHLLITALLNLSDVKNSGSTLWWFSHLTVN